MSFNNMFRAFGMATVMAAGPALVQAGQYRFSDSSCLSQGRWIKVEVSEAGIYELSYDRLRELGLNPDGVSVFGHGGAATSYNLVSGGRNNVADDLVQVPVYRAGNKIYFYGQGLCNPKIGVEGYEFDEQNIFTDRGHYFLTDGLTSLSMTQGEDASDLKGNAVDCSAGYDYRINNEDRIQGLERAGLLYWNYKMTPGKACYWDVPVDYMRADGKAVLTAKSVLFGNSEGTGAWANISLYINGDRQLTSYSQPSGVNHNGQDVRKSVSRQLTAAGNSVNVGVTLDSSPHDIYFDWWMLNYPKEIPVSDAGMVQQRLGVSATGNARQNGFIKVDDSWVVMDVTDPAVPMILAKEGGKAYLKDISAGHDLMVFDPARTQMVPTNPQPVANQNLHGVPDCSLLIVTVPEYRGCAEEIADLHREHDGINVVVATADQVYNEFTGGNPHPMAYRMLVKMLHERQEEPLKNVLFLGPIRSDARNVNDNPNMHDNFLIGMQEGGALAERVPALTMGFYGNTDDNLQPTAQEYAAMQVGIGLLPVKDNEDCRLAVSKIRRYLSELKQDGFAWIVNETMGMSCSGDQHLHDNQALNYRNELQTAVSGTGAGTLRHTTLMPGFYSEESIGPLMNYNLNEGKMLSLYIGHAGAVGLGNNVQTGDFLGLKNRIPSFMVFAGCDLMLPDHGNSGIVIESVLHAPRGLVGALGSTRMAWANQNYQLASTLAKKLFRDRKDATRTEAPTMGEAFACAMSTDVVHGSNKLVYEYIGDPALIVPVPMRGIESEFSGNLSSFRGGDVILMDGHIAAKDGDTPFNGTAVLKLCEPSQIRSQLEDPTYTVESRDVLVTSVSVKVEDGRFMAKVPVPADCDRFLSKAGSTKNMHLYIGAYDPSQRLAASGYAAVPMARSDEQRVEQPSADEVDNLDPEVMASYDSDSGMLTLTASDNVGLLPGVGSGAGIVLNIDGSPVTVAPDVVGSQGVSSYKASVYVGDYSIGQHTAEFSAMDLMGNMTAEQELDFTVRRDTADVGLSVAREYAIDSMEFTVDAKGREDLVLTVFDADGRRVYEENGVDGTVTWDCSGVKAGIYRAAVRATDGRKCRSGWITFSVMD